MKSRTRPFVYAAVIAVVAFAYFLGRGGRNNGESENADVNIPDPGYAARDATVIETGYDGRERYRLTASVIRQQTEAGVIALEQFAMDYHPDAKITLPGASAPAPSPTGEVWHLTSDHGLVHGDGDDVQLTGNVHVTGPAQGSAEPLSLTTDNLRIHTNTEFIETKAPVKLRWAGHDLNSRGLQADLKAGTLRLESNVNGHFFPK